MNFTRNLKMGMSGNDILYIKKKKEGKTYRF